LIAVEDGTRLSGLQRIAETDAEDVVSDDSVSDEDNAG